MGLWRYVGAMAITVIALGAGLAFWPRLDRPAVLVGAGDIATCDVQGDEATGALLDSIGGAVITLGDNAYEHGALDEFTRCYGPSWGRHRSRTYPAAGNHEYLTWNAEGYFSYYGAAAGPRGSGYYSYEAGAWHVVVLNSHCVAVGGCGAGSRQERWLYDDLAAHPTRCTLAYWHEPLFTSKSTNPPNLAMRDIWRTLQDAGVDLVLSGHNHHYERFAPLDLNGQRDDARGIREFIVGTGGAPLRPIGARARHSEIVNHDTHGVLKLTLYADSYVWEFVPVEGRTFRDSGRAACH